jgi:LacI family transcriptional regulator
MDKLPSIVDVARHAGVSVSTVSLVMNNRPNVAPDTAQAVWRSVRALDYRPGGPTGRKRGPKPGPRRPQRVPRLLFLHTGRPPAYFRTDLHSGVLHGVVSRAAPSASDLLISRAEEDDALDLLRRSRVDGVLVVGRVAPGRLRDGLRRVPCVQALGPVPADIVWDHVSHDGAAVARCVGNWFAGNGHRHCAVVQACEATADHTSTLLRQTVEQAGGFVREVSRPDLLSFDGVYPALSPASLSGILAELADGACPPTGVFLGTDLLTGPVYGLFRSRGLEPGRDVHVLCCSPGGPCLCGVQPCPARINVHPEQVGLQAVEQLLWRVEHRNEPHVVRLVQPTLC